MFDEIKPHLVELRKRLGISVLALLFFFVLAFFFHEPLMSWMIQPLSDALNAGSPQQGQLNNFLADGKITTHQVGGAFFVALKVSFFAAIFMALPVILWQIWLFVAPGLYANEKRLVLPFVIGGTTMFVVGALFAYYVVTPFGFEFLLMFGSFKFTPYINIEDYVGFFSKIMFGFGVAFELPIFTLFLALLGFVTDKSLKDFFKYAVVIIFIVAALLTPPDVMTQLLMAGPLVILYGFSIIIAKIVNPHKEEPEEEDEPENTSAKA